jgi:hypothetical protein
VRATRNYRPDTSSVKARARGTRAVRAANNNPSTTA